MPWGAWLGKGVRVIFGGEGGGQGVGASPHPWVVQALSIASTIATHTVLVSTACSSGSGSGGWGAWEAAAAEAPGSLRFVVGAASACPAAAAAATTTTEAAAARQDRMGEWARDSSSSSSSPGKGPWGAQVLLAPPLAELVQGAGEGGSLELPVLRFTQHGASSEWIRAAVGGARG